MNIAFPALFCMCTTFYAIMLQTDQVGFWTCIEIHDNFPTGEVTVGGDFGQGALGFQAMWNMMSLIQPVAEFFAIFIPPQMLSSRSHGVACVPPFYIACPFICHWTDYQHLVVHC